MNAIPLARWVSEPSGLPTVAADVSPGNVAQNNVAKEAQALLSSTELRDEQMTYARSVVLLAASMGPTVAANDDLPVINAAIVDDPAETNGDKRESDK